MKKGRKPIGLLERIYLTFCLLPIVLKIRARQAVHVSEVARKDLQKQLKDWHIHLQEDIVYLQRDCKRIAWDIEGLTDRKMIADQIIRSASLTMSRCEPIVFEKEIDMKTREIGALNAKLDIFQKCLDDIEVVLRKAGESQVYNQ